MPEPRPAAIQVLEIRPVTNCGAVRAFVKLQLGGLTIYDVKVVRQENQTTAWVALPQKPIRPKADGSGSGYVPVVTATASLKERIDSVVLEAWAAKERRVASSVQDIADTPFADAPAGDFYDDSAAAIRDLVDGAGWRERDQ